MSTKFVDFERLKTYDGKIKSHIKKTDAVNLTLAEYEERLANYRADNTYVDPDSGVSFAETLYNITDDFCCAENELSSNIVYADNYNIGVETVQEALDYVVKNKAAKSDLDTLIENVNNNATQVSNHINNTNIHVTSEDKVLWNTVSNKVDKTTPVTATFLTTSWKGTEAPFTYELTVNGVTTSTNVDITYNAETITEEQYNALSAAKIIKAVRSSNMITFTAYGDKPTVNIPIIVTVGGV